MAISDAAATTAAELGAQLAEQVMGAVHKVLNQFEGAGSTTLAACGTKLAACEAILKSMQEKVTELQQLKPRVEVHFAFQIVTSPADPGGLAIGEEMACL